MELKTTTMQHEEPIWVSVHDMRVTEVVCGDGFAELRFAEGFVVVRNGEPERTASGSIRLDGCAPEDISCYLIHKCPTRRGLKLRGREITLQALGDMLGRSYAALELFDEHFDGGLYLHGTLYPTKPSIFKIFRTLGVDVIIKTDGFFPVTYSWE